jgi:RNA polymerase subunit RPABC4/transcription elongation factor Spt4
MSVPSGGAGRPYEVVVHGGRGAVLMARLRAAGHGGRLRLDRVRRWLRTPQGRRAAVTVGRSVALATVLLGGWALTRRWAGAVQAALVAGFRRVAGAVDDTVGRFRSARLLGWLAPLLRWWSFLSRSGSRSPARRDGHIHCADCHARIRTDARVCYRCGRRRKGGDIGDLDRDDGEPRQLLVGALVWTWRVLALRLYRRCPDCRRLMHADARVCRSCGHRLRG